MDNENTSSATGQAEKMKPFRTILTVFAIGFIAFSIVLYIFFRSTAGFISSIDGNSTNSNYTHVVGDYSIFNVEQSVCFNTGDGYTRLTGRTDSLCWDEDNIVGYSDSMYFRISVDEEKFTSYSVRDSLLQVGGTLPLNSILLIPRLK